MKKYLTPSAGVVTFSEQDVLSNNSQLEANDSFGTWKDTWPNG